MSSEKLSSDEIPRKFAEWLLSMGCPAEKVPSLEIISQMCIGQYYMVWRSLMEHVQSKHFIREKRLQVFCDDIRLCKQRSPFNERNNIVVEPVMLTAWSQQNDIRKKVSNAEKRLNQAHIELNDLVDKVSGKLCQKNIYKQRIDELQRRVWLLRHISNELEAKKNNLEETRSIAASLCCSSEESNVQTKLDSCMSVLMKGNVNPTQTVSNLSSVSTPQSQSDEKILSLVKCRGDVLWPKLYEKRAKLVALLSAANAKHEAKVEKSGYRSVVAYTAALHCGLALETMKNQANIKQIQSKIQTSIEALDSTLSGEACELFVLRCERECAEAKVKSLRALADELRAGGGAFRAGGDDTTRDAAGTTRLIAVTDKDIASTRDEINGLVTSLSLTEYKINGMRDCLLAAFDGFRGETLGGGRYRGIQTDSLHQSISTMCKFYSERSDRRNRNELSMELDLSEYSLVDENSTKFSDEMKVYLRNFNIEKNRKIVLDNGKKVWIFETVSSLASRLRGRWLAGDVAPALCPSRTVEHSLDEIVDKLKERTRLRELVASIGAGEQRSDAFDIEEKNEEQNRHEDHIKKRIADNLTRLENTQKSLDVCEELVKFWENNEVRNYVSSNRTVGGKSFSDYIAYYKEVL